MAMDNFVERLNNMSPARRLYTIEMLPYTIEMLPKHLAELGQVDRLSQMLTNLRFIEAKCAAGMTYGLIADYNVALDVLLEAQEEKQKELEHEQYVKKYTEDMINYARAWNDARERHAIDPKNNPMPEPEDIPLPEIIPSVEPWSEEKIKKDTERIINNPTRLDKIRAFSQFVNSESHALVKFALYPGFVMQQAYNSAGSGPVVSMAEKIVSVEVGKILFLQTPPQRSGYNPHPALLRTLETDTSSVGATPDGKKAVSGSDDKTLRVWDLESGECLRILKGHAYRVNSVSITPDGKKAVSGSDDKTLRVWDLESGECLRILEGHTDIINSVSITPDGKKAVSGSDDHDIRVWDLEHGKCVKIFEGYFEGDFNAVPDTEDPGVHYEAVRSVSITPDGKKAVSGGDDETLRIWDLESGECLRTFLGHRGPIVDVNITPDGKKAVSGSNDHTLRVWEIETGKCLRILKGHAYRVNSVSITPDGKKAVSGSDDKTLRIWDLESGRSSKSLKILNPHRDFVFYPLDHDIQVRSVSITIDGKRAISRSNKDNFHVWDFKSGKRIGPSKDTWYSSVTITPDGKRAVTSEINSHTIQVWDLNSVKCLKTLRSFNKFFRNMNITPDGQRIVSSNHSDIPLYVLNLESGEYLIRKEHTDRINSIAVTLDGKKAVSGSDDKTLRVWEIETGKCLRILKGHAYRVNSVSITPDGKKAVSGSDDKTLRVWDLESGKCLRTLEGHTGWVWRVSITPDGKRAVSGGSDGAPRVWDLESGKCLQILEGHTGSVSSVNIAPDGKRAVSESNDRTLRVWDLDRGECVAVYQAHGGVSSLSEIRATGHFAVGVSAADKVLFFTLRNFLIEPPIITAFRLWLYKKNGVNSHWDDKIRTVCQWCGKRFPVANEILDVIRSINRNAGLSPHQSPCLELPDEAWDDPRLLSECPHCHKPLRFNPFVVDNQGRRSWKRLWVLLA